MTDHQPGTRRVNKLFGFELTPIYVNAYALVLNQVSSAGLGFVYWLLAARLYGVEIVGTSSAAISTLLLISGLAQFSLAAGMARFVPRAGRHTRRLLVWGYVLTAASTALFGTLALWVYGIWRPKSPLFSTAFAPWLIVLVMVLWSVFSYQDGALIGLHRAVWVFIENLIFNVAKIVLLVLGASVLLESGILGSWFAPTPFLVLLVGCLIFFWFVPAIESKPHVAADDALTLREIATSVTGDHVGSLVAETSIRLLPALVLGVLGAAAAAYFYQSWMIAMALTSVANGMTGSFTAEAATDRERIAEHSRAILGHMARVLVPAVAFVGLIAPWVLMMFGAEYARNATTLLRWLALATIPSIFNSWYLNYARVLGRIRTVIAMLSIRSALLLGVGYFALPVMGIQGIGVAWLVGNLVVAVIGTIDTWDVLRPQSGSGGNARGVTPQQLLRRADWRFLLPEPKPGKTAVFVDGLLGEAVRAVATHSVDGRSPEAFGCRLAVLADPQPAEVSAAFSALEPGATCYSEWSAWRAGGPSGVRSRLECAGFADVRLYWPVPGLASCRAWFEARPDAGYRRAVDDVLTSSTSRRSARLVLPLIANAILRFRLMPSLCAVAHRPNHADPMPGTPTVDFPDVVLSLVSQAEGVDPDDSLLVTRAGGMVIDSKVNWPIYAGAATDVRWIAKAPRTECSAARLACERDALALLGDRPDADGLLVPRLVFWGDVEGVPLLVQTALIGESLTDRVHRVGFDEVAEDGTNALIALARHAKVEPRGHWWGEIMEPQLVKLERVLDPLGERDLAVAVREALAPLGDLPMVVAHNDCTPWNAAIAGHRMGLFDWEEFEPSGLPLADLLFLLANIAFIIDGTEGRTDAVGTYEGLIGGSDARAAVFGRCVRRYAESVGVGPADIAPLRLATWVRHTAWDIENLLADTDGPLTGILSRSSCVPILRAELARSSRRPEAPGDRF